MDFLRTEAETGPFGFPKLKRVAILQIQGAPETPSRMSTKQRTVSGHITFKLLETNDKKKSLNSSQWRETPLPGEPDRVSRVPGRPHTCHGVLHRGAEWRRVVHTHRRGTRPPTPRAEASPRATAEVALRVAGKHRDH